MDRTRFDQFVREAWEALPPEVLERLHNVVLLIADEPPPDLLRSLGLDPRRDTLFGLYQGVPLKERGAFYANQLPDSITLFYRPLVSHFPDERRLRREIRKTIVHEVAHFLGMTEKEIRCLGY